jgi:outer membrane protein assembly factor BamB
MKRLIQFILLAGVALGCDRQSSAPGPENPASQPPSAAVDSTGEPAADWPMYRGAPSLAGVAPGSLPEQPALLWSFKTEGPVKSSAAIVGGRVYIGSNDRNLYALELATGKKIWAFTNSEAIESSPLVLNGKVFVGSGDANLYALDAATGKELWRFTTGEKILGAPNWFVAEGRTNILVGSYDYRL